MFFEFLFFCGIFGFSLAEEVTLQFLMLNDIYQYERNEDGLMGMDQAAALIKNMRTEPSFFTVSGDFVGGSQWGIFEGKPMIEILNEIQTSYVVIGNHEFDYGPNVTLQRIQESEFSWFGTNILDRETGEPWGGLIDVATQEVPLADGSTLTVGFFGVCVVYKATVSSPGPDVSVTNILNDTRAAITKLQGLGAQVIVGVTHLDMSDDEMLLQQVPEIDLILGGHEHIPLEYEYENKLVLKCGQNAESVGEVNLTVTVETDPNTQEQTIASKTLTWRRVPNDQQESDEAVTAIVANYRAQYDEYLANLNFTEVLTHIIDEPLSTLTTQVRSESTAIGTAVAESASYLYNLAIPLGIFNGGGIRGDEVYEVGVDFTRQMIYDNLRFPGTFYRLKIEGQYVRNALNEMLRSLPEETGNFPQISSAFNVTYAYETPTTALVQEIRINGEILIDDYVYDVVTSDFLAGGGDGVSNLTNGNVHEHNPTDIREAFADYLKKTKVDGFSGTQPQWVITDVTPQGGNDGQEEEEQEEEQEEGQEEEMETLTVVGEESIEETEQQEETVDEETAEETEGVSGASNLSFSMAMAMVAFGFFVM